MVAALVALAAPPAAADGNFDVEDIPGLDLQGLDGTCIAVVSGATGLRDAGAGTITVDVPGPPVAAVLEWAGQDDSTPPAAGQSTLSLAVTSGPDGPVAPFDVDGIRLPGSAGETFLPVEVGPDTVLYAWIANVSAGFASAGSYTAEVSGWTSDRTDADALRRTFGATLTIVYDVGTCDGPREIVWRGGADKFFGGTRPEVEIEWGDGIANEGHTTDLFLFPVTPSITERTALLQVTTGGVQRNETFCRESSLWYAAGAGEIPDASADLVDFEVWGEPFAVAATGGVEIVRNPFANPDFADTGGCVPVLNPTDSVHQDGHPCPDGPDAGCPHRAVRLIPEGGGYLGPEWALIDVEIVVPPGATWLAFQIESPTDQLARTAAVGRAIPPESGVWAGQMLLTIGVPTGQVEVTKTVSGDRSGLDPESRFTVVLDCDNGDFDRELDLGADESVVVPGLPLGTSCTVIEAAPPPVGPGFEWLPATVTPGTFTVTDEGTTVSVVVDNPIGAIDTGPEVGSLEIAKDLAGLDPAQLRDLEFGIDVDCTDDAFDQQVTITPTRSATIADVPLGTECTLTEVVFPEFVDEGSFGDPQYLPAPTVTIDGAVLVTVVNSSSGTLDEPPATVPPTTAPPTTGAPTTVPDSGLIVDTGADSDTGALVGVILVVAGLSLVLVAQPTLWNVLAERRRRHLH